MNITYDFWTERNRIRFINENNSFIAVVSAPILLNENLNGNEIYFGIYDTNFNEICSP